MRPHWPRSVRPARPQVLAPARQRNQRDHANDAEHQQTDENENCTAANHYAKASCRHHSKSVCHSRRCKSIKSF